MADQLDDAISVLRNNGNANFTQPATSPEPAGDTPAEVAAADLDDDGDTDLAVANAIESTDTKTTSRSSSTTATATSPRRRRAPRTRATSRWRSPPPTLTATAIADLATADQQSNTVTVLRNNGSANFNQASGSPELAGSFPQDIVAARLDADASIDLAAVNQGSSSENVTILRNRATRTSPSRRRAPSPWAGGP